MNKFLSFAVSVLLASEIFSGCGGGGNSNSTKIGNLVDGPIEGVDYVCGTHKGITGNSGQFEYSSGDKCTFKVDKVIIGEASPDNGKKGIGFITPMDLANVNDINNSKVIKIAKFFLTFDSNLSDKNITISDKIRDEFKNKFPDETDINSSDVSIDWIKGNFDSSEVHDINDTEALSHLGKIDEVIKEIKNSKKSNSTSFTAVDIPIDSIKNKKIVFNSGNSYMEIYDNGFKFNDGRENGDGSWIYEDKTLYLWKGEPYEYTIQFSDTPATGVKIKISERSGEETQYSTITKVLSKSQ